MNSSSSAKWFKNAIIYHILIDRFAGYNSSKNWEKPQFIGGNIQGIIDKFDYIIKLGVNTIWISPHYKTSEYHGYHITDIYQVDPHFGTIKDLKKLINLAHKNEIKIIADFVPNHFSKSHPYFIDAQKNKNSDYKNWFYFKKWPGEYLCFLSIKELPKINLEFQPARDHIIDAAKYWINLGFDGFRLDHVIGPSHNFWKEFRNEIKKEKPDSVLIGEAWMQGIKFKELQTINVKNKYLKWLFGPSSDRLLKEYTNLLDGVLDFKLQEIIKDHIIRENDIHDLKKNLDQHYNKYPNNYFLPNFLDNHDMDRFLFSCNNDKEKIKKAAEIQFSTNQPVIIYYGTEIGMSQQKSVWDFPAHGDIQARQPMQWKKIDKKLLNFYKKLIKQRNQ